MQFRDKTYVYKGRYSLLGAQPETCCRMFVKPHVRLPFGDVNNISSGHVFKSHTSRNRRSLSQGIQHELTSANLHKRHQKPHHKDLIKKGMISSKFAWLLIFCTFLLLGSFLLNQYGKINQKNMVVSSLINQIELQHENIISLKEEYLDASDETKIRYQAIQQGLIAPKGVKCVEVMAPLTRTTENEKIDIPQNTGIFASLFVFLN